MLNFQENENEEQPPRRPRLAALSGAFLAMIGLTLAAMIAGGFLLFWVVRSIQT